MPMTMEERLEHARTVLTAYLHAKGEALPETPFDFMQTDASDLIADLLHLQKHIGFNDKEITLSEALMHYEGEQADYIAEVRYTILSSHGELTADGDGYVLERNIDNDYVRGGRVLAVIDRFDLAEWREHWGSPATTRIDILDVGYLYTDPDAEESGYEPPDEQWRKEIAQILLERKTR